MSERWAHARAHPWRVLQTAFSFRLMLGVLLIAAIPAVLGSLLHPILGSVIFVAVFVPLWVLSATDPANVLYCPFCSKRVKIGADACHHCGRVLTPAAGSG